MKDKRQIKSCRYCKNYLDRGKYCYAFQINVSSTRNATHCSKYSEVPVGRKKKIIEASKHRTFYGYRT